MADSDTNASRLMESIVKDAISHSATHLHKAGSIRKDWPLLIEGESVERTFRC
jgi:hypothetical protein